MDLTPENRDPHGNILPEGVYATDIAPWTPMTQRDLTKVFYFSPRRRARADVSWFVALCNDTSPPFEDLMVGHQWWKPDEPVNPIVAGKNPMP
jgi:hypothetical protein